MKLMLDRFYAYLQSPLFLPARGALILLTATLAIAFTQPLWRITLKAPQYPQGLTLDILLYTIRGGNQGQHLQEINTLNHYIGMRPLNRAEFSDLDWLPFAFGALGLLALRVAAIGTVRSLIDLSILTVYTGLFALFRFYYMLYTYGHDLAPDAPMKVTPFSPPALGTKQVANFTISSYPRAGTFLIGIFALGILALLLWHLVAGRRGAVRARTVGHPAPAPA